MTSVRVKLLTLILLLPLTLWGTKATAANQDDQPAQRIITIAPNAAEILHELGVGDRVVGVSRFCVYPPEFKDRPRVGGLLDPDLEKIVSLRPDLVILRGRSEAVESLCRQRNIDFYFDRTETLGDVVTCITDLGQRTGRTAEADALIKRFNDRLETIRSRAKNQPRPRVLMTSARSTDRLSDLLTTGPGTFLDDLITAAGGTNVFHDLDMPWPQVSMESVIVERPQVIIEMMPEVELTDELRARLLRQWKQFPSLPAVRENRIHFITADNALIPSPRCLEVLDRLSRLLHPEAARDED